MDVTTTPVRKYNPLLMDPTREWSKAELLEDLPRWLKAGMMFKSQRDVAHFYGVKYQTLSDWLKGAPICRIRIGRRKVVSN